jgi:protein-tyrosine phosphatase
MAEAIFRNMVRQKGLDNQITTDSSGTSGWNIGQPPHKGTRKILDSHGIPYDGMKATNLEKRHLKEFDGIIAMDEENLSDILSLKDKNTTAWIKLLSDFVKGNWVSVPDPWHTGDFEETYKLVTEGCEMLLEHIVENGVREIT